MEAFPSPLESAKFIAGKSKHVSVDEEGARRLAESLFDKAAAEEFGLAGWKSLHELNPRSAGAEAVDWVFLVDSLNFSFWSEREEQKYLVKYKGKTYSGYWSLCAAVNRALDDGEWAPAGRRAAPERPGRGGAAAAAGAGPWARGGGAAAAPAECRRLVRSVRACGRPAQPGAGSGEGCGESRCSRCRACGSRQVVSVKRP